MPTREQTIADAVHIFENALYPNTLTSSSAWLGIYQTLLWYEPIHWVGFEELPHIIDADKLRPATPAKRNAWPRPKPWQQRAEVVNRYYAERLGLHVNRASQQSDLLMKHPAYQGMQRQNPLGTAFIGLIQHVLEKFGSKEIIYETEVEVNVLFPGITFPGRSRAPRMDVLVTKSAKPLAIISAKWSLRHDRVNDITNECPVYKAAYQRIYRQDQSGKSLLYFVVTNEYDPARLTKLLDDTCVNGIVHVHKPAVVEVCRLDSRLTRLLDLEELVLSTSSW